MSSFQCSNNEKVCIVAILKDEINFIDEWLVYHKLIGIDHFFLYDNDPKFPLQTYTEPHSSYVTIIPWVYNRNDSSEPMPQLAAYRHAVDNLLTGYEWVAFIDGDEFIVLKENDDIHEFLVGFKHFSAVSLNWHLFGHNGFYDNPEHLITATLIRRMKMPSIRVKTITRVNEILLIRSAHYCELRRGTRVDANLRQASDRLYPGKTNRANINHYQSRSFKNWMNRVNRGDVNFNENGSPSEHLWRLSFNGILKQFVTNLAKDKNEFIDLFMCKFENIISEKLRALRVNEKNN